jgi:hypothetical protein
MFHPSSKSKSVWNVIIVLLLIYTATVMPYKLAFIDAGPDSPWFVIELVVDA